MVLLVDRLICYPSVKFKLMFCLIALFQHVIAAHPFFLKRKGRKEHAMTAKN